MDDESLDHQLRRLAARRPPSAPEGIEAEVWRRIRERAAAASQFPVYLTRWAFVGSLALAAALGVSVPLLGDPLPSIRPSSSAATFDRQLFSVEAPTLRPGRLISQWKR